MKSKRMNETIHKIESALKIILPSDYKDALLHYPFSPLDKFDCVEDNLVNECDWLIDSNQELREIGFFGNQWPSHFFAIGHDGFGNYIFLCLLGNDEAVYIADHEEDFNQNNIADMELASDMKEFIEICLEDQQDIVNNV